MQPLSEKQYNRMEKQENIIATYQQIIQETEKQLQKARKRIRYISLLRLILFVEAVASAIIFWSDGWLKLIVLTVLPIIAFIWLVQSHNRRTLAIPVYQSYFNPHRQTTSCQLVQCASGRKRSYRTTSGSDSGTIFRT